MAEAIDEASRRTGGGDKLAVARLDKLREVRQAFITAAVTGQIDIAAEDAA